MRRVNDSVLDCQELLELEDNIKSELDDYLTAALTKLNRLGQIEEFLKLLGMEHLLQKSSGYEVHKSGKIVVVGQSSVSSEVLLTTARKLGIDKSRFELYLDYEDAKKIDFKKFQWQPKYSLIMVGPMPHSGISKGSNSSIIDSLETEEGYPPVVRLDSNGLKITKSTFTKKLKEMIKQNIIYTDSI